MLIANVDLWLTFVYLYTSVCVCFLNIFKLLHDSTFVAWTVLDHESWRKELCANIQSLAMLQIGIVALISMTVFFRTTLHQNMEDGQLYMGAVFFGVVIIMFNGYAELSMAIFRLPVFYKQRDLLFYPAWAYALPSLVLSIPSSIAEAGIYSCISYYVIGYAPEASRWRTFECLSSIFFQIRSSLFWPSLPDRMPCYTELANRNPAVDLTSLLLSASPQVLPIIFAAIFDAPDVFGDVPSDCWIVSDYGGG